MSHAPALKDRSLFPIILTYFLDNFGLALVYPIFTPLFLKLHYSFLPEGFTTFQRTFFLGLTIASFPFAQLFGAPLIGQFSDVYGRKKSFFITILGVTIGYYLTAISLFTHSISFLIFSRIWTGFFAGNLTICLAAVADLSPDEKTRTKNFGLIAVFGGLSFMIAIIMGGIFSNPELPSFFHPALPFVITGTLTLINLFLMIQLFQESHPTRKHLHMHFFRGIHNIKNAVGNPNLRIIYLIYFLFMVSWTGSMQLLPAILLEVYKFTNIQIVGIFVLVGTIWSMSNLIINRPLAKRISPVKTFRFCLLCLSCMLLIEGFPDNLALFLTLILINVCFASLGWSNGIATVSLSAPDEVQGSILGINQSMISLASILGPLIGGFIAGFKPHLVYFFTGLCALASFSLLWVNRRRIPPPQEPKIS